MVDLKPCPFCGGVAKTDACMDPSLVRCVSDTRPHCPASFGGVSVETWNRRSSIAAEKAEEPDAPGIAEAPDGTLPCVYCSNENLCVEIRDDKHPGMLGFSVRCGSAFCGARGPVRPAQMDAVEEWNRAYRWVHPPKAEEPAPSPQAQGEVCEKPDAASPVKPCPDVPFGSLGNDVEETLDALLGFGRSARMVERAQLRNEIAGLLSRRTPAPSPATGESAIEELSDAEAERLYNEAKPVPFGAHEVERFVRVTVDPQAEVLALQKQRNDVYEERDRLVAALSKCFPSWLARHPDTDKAWDDDWRWIVFVQLPTGQATWHIHDRERAWFDHLEVRENVWDGHTTEEKYRRLERLPAREAQGEPTLEECETAYDEAWRNADIGSLSVDDIKNPGVAAVRSLCLAHRAPSPSPALAAIVEAGDAMRAKVAKIVDDHRGAYFERGLEAVLVAYDEARAALPKECV